MTKVERKDKIVATLAVLRIPKSEAAKLIGLARSTFSLKLTGVSEWSVKELEALAEVCKKPNNYFL